MKSKFFCEHNFRDWILLRYSITLLKTAAPWTLNFLIHLSLLINNINYIFLSNIFLLLQISKIFNMFLMKSTKSFILKMSLWLINIYKRASTMYEILYNASVISLVTFRARWFRDFYLDFLFCIPYVACKFYFHFKSLPIGYLRKRNILWSYLYM